MALPTLETLENTIATLFDYDEEEFTEEQKLALLDELGNMEVAKVDNIARFIRLETAQAEAYRAESQRLMARAKTVEAKLDWLKSKYVEIMQTHGIKQIKGNAYTVSLRPTKSVQIDDMNALRENAPWLVKTKVEEIPDKRAIRDVFASGKNVPGCQLQERQTLQVR